MNIENVRSRIVNELRALIETTPNPDAPIVGCRASGPMSLRQLLVEIESNSEFGREYIEKWIAATYGSDEP